MHQKNCVQIRTHSVLPLPKVVLAVSKGLKARSPSPTDQFHDEEMDFDQPTKDPSPSSSPPPPSGQHLSREEESHQQQQQQHQKLPQQQPALFSNRSSEAFAAAAAKASLNHSQIDTLLKLKKDPLFDFNSIEFSNAAAMWFTIDSANDAEVRFLFLVVSFSLQCWSDSSPARRKPLM